MKSKISFFLPSFNIGGVERVFINYANALSDKGYNVDFVVCMIVFITIEQPKLIRNIRV